MGTLKISKSGWFWILQFIGWGLPSILMIYVKLSYEESLSEAYIISEGILFASTGILFTSLLRLFVRNKFFYDIIDFKIAIKTGVIYLCTSFLMTLFVEIAVYFLYTNIENKELDRSFGDYGINFINTSIYILFWLILYFSINSIIKQKKEKEKRLQLKTTLKESQLNTLKGQINPHFMFNSLNNIRGLMLEDVHKSREMITKLSELLRYSLNSNKVNTISLREEIEIVNNYIELSKIQFENRLNYKEEIATDVLDHKIPPMLIQMLIENAIKHGISNQIDGGEVHLKVFEEYDNLCISVVNTGSLIENTSSTKIGLQNIKERLRLLFGSQSSFGLIEVENKVKALIKIPLDG